MLISSAINKGATSSTVLVDVNPFVFNVCTQHVLHVIRTTLARQVDLLKFALLETTALGGLLHAAHAV